MKNASAVVVLVGEKTKNLYKYVRWELELALELGLPINSPYQKSRLRFCSLQCRPRFL